MSIQQEKKLMTPNTPNWCPGCGDFAVWQAFKEAAIEQGWDNTNSAIVAGIGCHGHMINFLKITAFEGLHGRALPVACGIKMANTDLNVFVFTGDGDSLAEGGNHFVHSARRNHNITIILHDNAIYGLTTGQTSPRTAKGQKTKSTPAGSVEEPLHPLRVALSAGATFLARVYAGDVEMLREIMIRANEHNGFSVIQVLQPCVTFNRAYDHIFYQNNIYYLDESYDRTDIGAAFAKTLEWGEKQIPVGVFYEVQKPSYEDCIPVVEKRPLVKQQLRTRDIRHVYDTLR